MHFEQEMNGGRIAAYFHNTLKLNVSDRNIRYIIASNRTEIKPHFIPASPHRYSDSVRHEVATIQSSNARLTLDDVQQRITSSPAPHVSTISRMLQQQHFTTKKLEVSVDARNSEAVKLKRIEYIHTFEENVSESNSIFIDETPWSQVMHRTTGRSPVNQPALISSRTLKSPNISLIAAISPRHGLLLYDTHCYTDTKTGVNASIFCDFIKKLLALPLLHHDNYYLIMDDASIHHKESINELIECESRRSRRVDERHHFLLSLPPYSPRLNPLENIFGIWKRDVLKTRMNNKQQVLDQIESGAERITSDLCLKCYNRMLTFFPAINDMNDLI